MNYIRRTLTMFEVQFLMILVAVAACVLLYACESDAASLRICFTEPGPDVAQIQVFAGPTQIYQDILAGTVSPGPTTCAINPIPASLVRGVAQPITLRGVNALGEVGPASNAVTFRAPLNAPIITGVTIQGLPLP